MWFNFVRVLLLELFEILKNKIDINNWKIIDETKNNIIIAINKTELLFKAEEIIVFYNKYYEILI